MTPRWCAAPPLFANRCDRSVLPCAAGCTPARSKLKRDDVTGIAVHIAARVAAEAEGGETVVSSTVRDLVAGSGLRFQDRGIRALKGLPEAVHLYSVLDTR
jgi:class 3 adenylate cyclase